MRVDAGFDPKPPKYRDCEEPTVKLCGHVGVNDGLMGHYVEAGFYNGRPYYEFAQRPSRYVFYQSDPTNAFGGTKPYLYFFGLTDANQSILLYLLEQKCTSGEVRGVTTRQSVSYLFLRKGRN